MIRISELEADVLNARQENRALKSKNAQLGRDIRDLNSELQSLHNELNSLQRSHSECEHLRKRLTEMEVLTEEHDKWAALAKERFAKMRAQRNHYKAELEEQKKEHETAMERLSELRMKVQDLETTHQRLLADLQRKARDQGRDYRSKIKALGLQIETMSRESGEAIHDNKRLSAQLRSSSLNIQKLEAENARLLTLVERLKRELGETRTTARQEPQQIGELEVTIPVTLSSYREEVTLSEPCRPAPFQSILSSSSKSSRDKQEPSPSDPSRQMIDFQGEINSLQREIESLKLELVNQ
jgi:chromosome segregation ATPase